MARLRLKYRRQHSIRVDSLVSTIAVAAQRQPAIWSSTVNAACLRLLDRFTHQAVACFKRLSSQSPAAGDTPTDKPPCRRTVVGIFLGAGQRVHCGHGDWLLSFATDYGSHRHAGIWRTIARPAVASPAIYP